MKDEVKDDSNPPVVSVYTNNMILTGTEIEAPRTLEEVPSFILAIAEKYKISGTGKVQVVYDKATGIKGNYGLILFPGTDLIMPGKDQLILFFKNGDNPSDYALCPKCDNLWKTRAERPKQCPRCHKLLEKFPIEEIYLEGWMKTHRGLHWTIESDVIDSIDDD